MSDITVNLIDKTGAVSQAGFGLILVFDPSQDQEYKEVEGTDDLENYSSDDLLYKIVARAFEQDITPDKVAIYGVDMEVAEGTIGDELDNLVTENDDFYWVGVASREDNDIQDVADWSSANGRVFIGQPDWQSSVEDIETLMDNFDSDRIAIFAHDGGPAGDEPAFDGGVLGYFAPLNIGDYTFKWQTINGVPRTSYSTTDISNLTNEDVNANTYRRKSGVNYVIEGVASDGSFLDIRVIKDWLQARLEEDILQLMTGDLKIAYDSSGIDQIESVIRARLKNAFNNGIIAQDEDGEPMFSIDTPTRDDVPTNDRANRILPDVEFELTLAGAIHEVEVTGVILA
ncbi:DUF3383 family protein [Natroniella sp. ANB-PHB2]|uniref:DUF3383 family protein n=1 Tax=Natroniella sp. ANB-PHB2 TaxID=3384444 RepID=UPI0038D3F57F